MSSRPEIERIASTIGRGGRSELYRWIWENYEEVQAARIGKPDWVGAAKEFTALGFRARGDQALSADAVRKTWQRVEADRAKAAGVAPSPKSAPIGAAVRPRPEISLSLSDEDDEPMQLSLVRKVVDE